MINEGLIVILAFFVLILLRAPVFLALGIPAIAYFLIHGYPLIFPSQRMIRMVDSFTLLAIPLFIFVGSIMNNGGITNKLFDFADDIVGHMDGGLAQVNILTSLIFSGISGSALADIGGVGRVLIDAMKDNGYSGKYSAALTSASATIGPIFPPSIPLIIYGLVAEVSVLDLLLAGALPAIVALIAMMIATHVIAGRRSFPSNEQRAPIGKIFKSTTIAMPALATPIVLLAGMFLGYFGPTEAAAFTVGYVIFVNALFYGKVHSGYIWQSAVETVRLTASIVIILAAAGLFAYVISIENIDGLFAGFLFSISENPLVLLLLVNILLLILGLFLDPIAAMIMSIPIVVPPLVAVGVDPVHFGVIMTFNLMLGLLTPPLGLSLFLSSNIAGVSLVEVIRELKVYYIVLLAVLILITYVPSITLIIPELAS